MVIEVVRCRRLHLLPKPRIQTVKPRLWLLQGAVLHWHCIPMPSLGDDSMMQQAKKNLRVTLN